MPGSTRIVHFLTFGLLLISAGFAWAEVCPSSQVPKAERDQYDALVPISPAQEATALQTHLPFGAPPCPAEPGWMPAIRGGPRSARWAARHS